MDAIRYASQEKSFNSIKVRLKLDAVPDRPCALRFQFHKGAIETIWGALAVGEVYNFQFHKGAIETE